LHLAAAMRVGYRVFQPAFPVFHLRSRRGASLTKKVMHIAIEAFERFFKNWNGVVAAGIDVSL